MKFREYVKESMAFKCYTCHKANTYFFHSLGGQYLASRLYHILYFIISNYPGKSCF